MFPLRSAPRPPLSTEMQNTGDHREKKGLETFLSFERYRGIIDAQRVGLGEKEHALAVSEQVPRGTFFQCGGLSGRG